MVKLGANRWRFEEADRQAIKAALYARIPVASGPHAERLIAIIRVFEGTDRVLEIVDAGRG